MRIPHERAGVFADRLIVAYIFGILGFYFQLHRIFFENQSDGIDMRAAKGFFVAAGGAFLLFPLFRYLPRLHFCHALKKLSHLAVYVIMTLSVAYFAYVLYENSKALPDLPIMRDIGVLYGFFLGATLTCFAFFRRYTAGAFAGATLMAASAACVYLVLRLNAGIGVLLALGYVLYLVCLGRMALAVIERIFDPQVDTVLAASMLSFVLGTLVHYLVWYLFGLLGLLYPLTAAAWIGLVVLLGVCIYGSRFRRVFSQWWHRRSKLLEVDAASSLLLHPTVFCLVLLFMLLCMKAPGHIDSRLMTYGASMYGFAKLHRIVILPFHVNWQLLFQPLLFEITGLPIFMVGGISAWRIFNGLYFFSFMPVLILFCRAYRLSNRVVILTVALYLTSSFTFRMAYSDKPEVMGFPAFLAFLVIALLALKQLKPWHLLALAALMGVIFNTKMVLIAGTFASFVVLAFFFPAAGPKPLPPDIKRAAWISSALVIVTCSVLPVQNLLLRGNPFHPFTAMMFGVGDRSPEETEYTFVPRHYYKKTMPVQMPSRIAGINLNRRLGMYRPFIAAAFSGAGISYGPTRDSISVVILLYWMLAPVFLWFNPSRRLLVCSAAGLTSFFIWFAWIGHAFRFSTAFPAMCLLTALCLGGNGLPHRRFDTCWRNVVSGLLLAGIPFALSATFEEKPPADVLRYSAYRGPQPVVMKTLSHPATHYLEARAQEKPVLLVADERIPKYGLYQPSFFFQPSFYTHKPIPMAYIAKIRPTHLLTTKKLDESILIRTYPFLRNYLELEKSFETATGMSRLYRFSADVPWDRYFNEYSHQEPISSILINDIERFLNRSRDLQLLD